MYLYVVFLFCLATFAASDGCHIKVAQIRLAYFMLTVCCGLLKKECSYG